MSKIKQSVAAPGRRGGGKQSGRAIADPTAQILDTFLEEYDSFDRHRYAGQKWLDRFGRSTANFSFRGEPETAGEAFNPVKALPRR